MNQDTLAAALMAGAATLIGKIIWDWLQEKRSPSKEKAAHCEDHECLARELSQLRLDWMKQTANFETLMAVMQNDISYIKRKLDMNGKA